MNVVGIRLSLGCNECRSAVPVRDLTSTALECPSCGERAAAPVAAFLMQGTAAYPVTWPAKHRMFHPLFDRVLAAEVGASLAVSSPDAHSTVDLDVRHAPLACAACTQSLGDRVDPEALLRGQVSCAGCHRPVAVTRASDAHRAIDPRIAGVFAAASERKPSLATTCQKCGATIDVDGSDRNVACRYCGHGNVLDDALWSELRGRRRRPEILLILELDRHGVLAARYRSNVDVARHDASNPATAIDVLWMLADHPDERVRAAIPANPTAPEDLLDHVARDESASVRAAAARSRRIAVEVLVRLAKDGDGAVREAVAGNARTPEDVVYALYRGGTSLFFHPTKRVVVARRLEVAVLAALCAMASFVVAGIGLWIYLDGFTSVVNDRTRETPAGLSEFAWLAKLSGVSAVTSVTLGILNFWRAGRLSRRAFASGSLLMAHVSLGIVLGCWIVVFGAIVSACVS